MTARSRAAATRRDLAGSLGAILLLGAAEAGPAKAVELDGALLRAYRLWQPWERERQAVCRLPDDDPTFEARFDAYTRPWHALVDEISGMPARTPEGIRAKAEVLRALLANHTIIDRGRPGDSMSETLAFSLVNDMLGRAAA